MTCAKRSANDLGPRRAALLALLALLAFGATRPAGARAFDEFQVYDGRIAEPGGFDYDQHFVLGRRGRISDGDAPRNGLMVMPEVGYATTAWHEVAVLLPVAREFSGDVFGGGFKVRNTFVLPKAHERPVAGGFDIEIRHQSTRFSEANWAMTLRPIADLRTGPWQLILNPNVEIPFGRGSPVFAPAARGVRQVSENVWLGVEHYMDFGRVDRWETARRQGHQLFATTDVRVSERLAVHAGLGHGLTRNSDRWVGKVILRLDF
ncbi:MAG: hypothetical protein ICV73_03495 [Acetobacteraceae bacterium]|nr:hypothetical protein [Acetobacteraceae bacterium]